MRIKTSLRAKTRDQKTQAKTAQTVIVAAIVLLGLSVIGVTVAALYLTPERQAMLEVEKLAKNYYEEHFYETLLANNPEKSAAEVLANYANEGFAPVYLRHLLIYDAQSRGESGATTSEQTYVAQPTITAETEATAKSTNGEAGRFTLGNYYCDTNSSSVRYYPESPYGQTDYRIEYDLTCQSE